jgi:hypothetical protein
MVEQLGVAGDERNGRRGEPLRGCVPNVQVCWIIDCGRWKRVLLAALREALARNEKAGPLEMGPAQYLNRRFTPW